MKYNLKRYLPSGLAIIVASTFLFNAVGEMKDSSKEVTDINSSKVYEDELKDNTSTSEKSMFNLKEKLDGIFNKEVEETTISFEQKEYTTREIEMKIKIVYDTLLKTCFKKMGTQKISMECRVPKDKIFAKSEITINAEGITDGKAFYNFLSELNEVCVVKTLCADSDTINEIKAFDLSFLEELEIESNCNYIGIVDLKNFNNLKSLSLEKVNADNIPASVEKMSFNGDNHSVYDISKELEFIKKSKNVWSVSFKNIIVPELNMPKVQITYLNFVNCDGDKNINISGSKDVYISYHNAGRESEKVVINGEIAGNMFIVSTDENVYAGNIMGNPEISFKVNTPDGIVESEIKTIGKTR